MSELDKGKASKTVYPDGVTEIKDDAIYIKVNADIKASFKARCAENKMNMDTCITKFIETYIGQ